MMNTSFFNKARDYRDLAAARIGNVGDMAKIGYDVAASRISVLLNKYLLSELCILQMMLVSFGILLGATFTGFFKKYRGVVLVAFLISVGLFVYKAFQLLGEWDEDNSGEF